MNGELPVENYAANEPRFTRAVAVELANISLEFLHRCEAEKLIEAKILENQEPIYSAHDIRRMALIYRLHDTLGVHVNDLEIVLHLRQQVLDLRQQVDDLERMWVEREERLLSELAALRVQSTDDVEWKG